MSLTPDLDPTSFSGQVPLFPLPNVVLLPGGLLPLHVFEERYRAMVGDALAGERLIGMALLQPGYEPDYEGAPAIEPQICVGRIVMEQPLAEGRYNMVLVGLRRARVVSEDHSRPYRLAQVELADDTTPEVQPDPESLSALRELLEALPLALVRDTRRLAIVVGLLRGEVPGELGLGLAIDLAADALHLGVADRMAILRCDQSVARLAIFGTILARRCADERGTGFPRWPKGFSRN